MALSQKWEIIKEGPITSGDTGNTMGWYYMLQCEQTGKVKHKKVYV